MRIDRTELRRHYESLSDEELLALDRADLSETAQSVYDEECAGRHLSPGTRAEAPGEPETASPPGPADAVEDTGGELDIDVGPPPDWLEDAGCAYSFAMRSETQYIPAAIRARAVLRAAGIPCQAVRDSEDTPLTGWTRHYLLRLMVPFPLTPQAQSVLERDVFNEENEAAWRTHLEALSDDELRALDPEIVCAGLLDRVARIRRAYADESRRRALEPRPALHP